MVEARRGPGEGGGVGGVPFDVVTPFLSPALRRWLPPVVLALGAMQALSVALQLLLGLPELPWLCLPFFAGAGLLGLGAWGLYREAFWARGFALGAFLSSGVGGVWFLGIGAVLPASVLCMLILLSDGAPERFEQRPGFREAKGLTREGARRLFFVALGLGLGLPALLGSPLALVLFVSAPLPATLAALLGVAGLIGLMRLETWSFFAVGGALVALVVALVASVLAGRGLDAASGSLGVGGLLVALGPLAGPVLRALRGRADREP